MWRLMKTAGMHTCPGPWYGDHTSLSYGPRVVPHGLWAHFRPRCDDTAIFRIPGRTHDPQAQATPNVPSFPYSLDLLPSQVAHTSSYVIATTCQGVFLNFLLRLIAAMNPDCATLHRLVSLHPPPFSFCFNPSFSSDRLPVDISACHAAVCFRKPRPHMLLFERLRITSGGLPHLSLGRTMIKQPGRRSATRPICHSQKVRDERREGISGVA